jgi:hypothetical protein
MVVSAVHLPALPTAFSVQGRSWSDQRAGLVSTLFFEINIVVLLLPCMSLLLAHNVSYCGAATCPELGANRK